MVNRVDPCVWVSCDRIVAANFSFSNASPAQARLMPKPTRRSPLKAAPLRQAGASIEDEIDRLRDDVFFDRLTFLFGAFMVWSMALVVWLFPAPPGLLFAIGFRVLRRRHRLGTATDASRQASDWPPAPGLGGRAGRRRVPRRRCARRFLGGARLARRRLQRRPRDRRDPGRVHDRDEDPQ